MRKKNICSFLLVGEDHLGANHDEIKNFFFSSSNKSKTAEKNSKEKIGQMISLFFFLAMISFYFSAFFTNQFSVSFRLRFALILINVCFFFLYYIYL